MTEPFSLQVVIDCASPHDLADWWAETLGWEVEPQDEAFIRSMIDQGFATDEETTLHNSSLVWAAGAAVLPAESTGQGQPRVLFQQVPESKAGKNRVHLDLRPRSSGERRPRRDPSAADRTRCHRSQPRPTRTPRMGNLRRSRRQRVLHLTR